MTHPQARTLLLSLAFSLSAGQARTQQLPAATQTASQPTSQTTSQTGAWLTAEEIATRLDTMNTKRKAALTRYESRRVMTVTYQGPLSQGEAAETVLMTFTAPGTRQFTVLSASGAQLIRDNVFQRALTAEQTAATPAAQQASALNLRNYTVTLVGRQPLTTCNCFVLDVAPRTPSEFTYTGRVWIDPTDFAVVRIEGKPSINPSPWITDGAFTTDFQKTGDFYFPHRTVSSSNLPLGLRAELTIQYGSYRILSAAPVRP